MDFVSGQSLDEINCGFEKYIDEAMFNPFENISDEMFPKVLAGITHCLSPLRKLERYKNIEFIQVGSTSEGVNIPEMEKTRGKLKWEFEMDILCVLPDIKVGCTKNDPAILMTQENTTSGYFLVYLNSPEYRAQWADFSIRPSSTRRSEELYLNPISIITDLYAQIEHIFGQIPIMKERFKLQFNPPAITMTLSIDPTNSLYISCDIVFALRLPYASLPSNYSSWFNFANKQPTWLQDDALVNIKNNYLHLVGKCSPGGSPKVEWRLSFNRIELMFFKKLNELYPIAVLCYKILKLIRSWYFKQPTKVIPSYFLKMILFKACHKLPTDVWNEKNLAYIILGLLDDLIFCLATRNLTSYFVPSCNYLEKIHCDFTQTILTQLVAIRHDPLGKIINKTFT